jgi:hypothetical protein
VPSRRLAEQKRIVVSRRVGVLRDVWQHERRQRPIAARLALIAGAMLAIGTALGAASSALLGELIAGIAVLPLSVALYLRLLPPSPWTLLEEPSSGPALMTEDHRGSVQSAGTDACVDWDCFERQFRVYAAKREHDQEVE